MIAVNNVIHLLVEFFLPFQNGIEVVGLIRALLGPDDGHLDDIAHDLFQGLTVFFIHRSMTSIIHMAATLFPTGPRSRKKSGTPISAPPPKQTSCLLVKLNATLVLTFVRSLGTGT